MKKSILSLALLAAPLLSGAQKYMGLATGNWAGTSSVYLNPANIGDARAMFVLDVLSVNASLDNDLVSVDMSKLYSSVNNYGFSINEPKQVNMTLPMVEARLLGLMLSYERNTFAFTTRVRFYNQFNNFDQRIISLATNPPSTPGAPYSLSTGNFNWTAQGWTEVRGSFAREVYNQMDHVFKAGFSIARLGGLGFLGMRGNIDGQFYPSNDSLHMANTDATFATSFLSSANQLKFGPNMDWGKVFGHEAGNGWSFDIGACYEFRPNGGGSNPGNPASNKYLVRASAALLDVGAITYNTAHAHVQAEGSMTAGDISKNLGNYRSFSDYAHSRGFSMDTGVGKTKVGLPTTLSLGLDVHAWRRLYVNLAWFKGMTSLDNQFGNRMYNQLTITPRYDSKAISVAFPLTINAISGFKTGFGFRVGGLFFGSDDLGGVLGKANGLNAYFGFFIPVAKPFKDTYRESTFPGDHK